MRIVVAIPYAPVPVTKGTDRLVLNLLEGLRARHEVVLVTMTLGRGDLERLREIERERLTVRAIVAPHRRSVLHRIYYKAKNVTTALVAGVPAPVSYAAPAELLRLIGATAAEVGADLIIASYWHLYRLPDYAEPAKLVLITHDLDFAVNPGRLRSKSGLARAAAARRLASLERIEMKAYERFDAILTVTAADAETLAAHPVSKGKLIRPLPLALDLAAFNPSLFERERNTIFFMGLFHSDFNRDALLYFTREVLPIVRAKNPDARLQVSGHGIDERLRAAAGSGVTFAGGVDDIRPYLGRCSLMVLPLRFSGGVRIRMMEAAAMGTPVVSTRAGVAGMGLEPGREYLEAESPAEMAAAILDLLANHDEARRIGADARQWAEKNLSLETYPDRLDALLAEIARGVRSRSGSRTIRT